MPNTKNYMEQGGERWVVGGTLEMSDGTHLVIGESTLEALLSGKLTATTEAFNAKLTANAAVVQADSTAVDIAGLVSDFNALLAKLKTAGLMANE